MCIYLDTNNRIEQLLNGLQGYWQLKIVVSYPCTPKIYFPTIGGMRESPLLQDLIWDIFIEIQNFMITGWPTCVHLILLKSQIYTGFAEYDATYSRFWSQFPMFHYTFCFCPPQFSLGCSQSVWELISPFLCVHVLLPTRINSLLLRIAPLHLCWAVSDYHFTLFYFLFMLFKCPSKE